MSSSYLVLIGPELLKNPEIPGVYTTHYSVRVVFGPSRVRVGQTIPSMSRVSSTRRSLILSLECLAQKLDCCNFTQKVKSMTDGWTWVGARDTFVSKNLLATDPDLIWSHHEAIKRDQNTKAIWLFKLLSVLNHKLQLWQIRKSRPRLPVGGPGSVCECHRVLCLPHQIDQSN